MTYNPGFMGGQCEGVVYRVTAGATATGLNYLGQPNGSTLVADYRLEIEVTGPIIAVSPVAGDSNGIVSGGPTGINLVKIVYTANGNTATSTFCNTTRDYAEVYCKNVQMTSLSISRVDGLPDNCGNLEPIWNPANPPESVFGCSQPTESTGLLRRF